MLTSRVCEHCGMCKHNLGSFQTKKNKRRANELTSHHIYNKEFFGINQNDEVITLCKVCHTRLHKELNTELKKLLIEHNVQTMYELFALYGYSAIRKFFLNFTCEYIGEH